MLSPLLEERQTTSHTPEALERMVECDLALGIPDEAWKASAVLGKNYAGTYWYRQSLRLLIAERNHTRGRAFPAAGETQAAAAPGAKTNSPEAPRSNLYPQGRKPGKQ